MPRCLTCMSLRLKGVDTARNGFGGCKFKPPHERVAVLYERQCATFAESDRDIADKRVQWARKALGAA